MLSNNVLQRLFDQIDPPCETYNCKDQELCKKGLACDSFKVYTGSKLIRLPTTPSEKMYNLIYGEE